MKLSEAKKHFKNAIKVECLTRQKEIEVNPGTVQKSFIGGKCLVMETKCGYFALVVDPYESKVAKITECKN